MLIGTAGKPRPVRRISKNHRFYKTKMTKPEMFRMVMLTTPGVVSFEALDYMGLGSKSTMERARKLGVRVRTVPSLGYRLVQTEKTKPTSTT